MASDVVKKGRSLKKSGWVMRVGLVVENVLERLALASGRVPLPILESFPGVLLAQAIMVGTRLGIFEALEFRALPAEALASLCRSEPRATAKLLHVLVAARYLRQAGERYSLTPMARHWLLASSPTSVRDYLLFNALQWEWMGQLGTFVRGGQPIDIHHEMTPDEWALYQRAMRCVARLSAPEMARRLRIPAHARAMLDIGGGHGHSSQALCQRHPHLRATVLDLPDALAHTAPRLASTTLTPRVSYRVADALTADLGIEQYDVIFMANLAHHFDAPTNAALARRVARALKSGGIFAIQEGIRPEAQQGIGQFAALGDLFFALTSEAGLYTFAEMAAWQCAAGLHPQRPMRLLTAPGQGVQVAVKR